MKVHI